MTTDNHTADDALPEPVAWGLSSGYMPGCILSPTTNREARTWTDWEPLFTADQLRAAIARERAEVTRLTNVLARQQAAYERELEIDRQHSTELLQAADHIRAGLEAELSTLRQRLADCARDAERYRWLRKMLNGDGFSQKDALLAACQDDMDAAIDAAIAAGAQK